MFWLVKLYIPKDTNQGVETDEPDDVKPLTENGPEDAVSQDDEKLCITPDSAPVSPADSIAWATSWWITALTVKLKEWENIKNHKKLKKKKKSYIPLYLYSLCTVYCIYLQGPRSAYRLAFIQSIVHSNWNYKNMFDVSHKRKGLMLLTPRQIKINLPQFNFPKHYPGTLKKNNIQ